MAKIQKKYFQEYTSAKKGAKKTSTKAVNAQYRAAFIPMLRGVRKVDPRMHRNLVEIGASEANLKNIMKQVGFKEQGQDKLTYPQYLIILDDDGQILFFICLPVDMLEQAQNASQLVMILKTQRDVPPWS